MVMIWLLLAVSIATQCHGYPMVIQRRPIRRSIQRYPCAFRVGSADTRFVLKVGAIATKEGEEVEEKQNSDLKNQQHETNYIDGISVNDILKPEPKVIGDDDDERTKKRRKMAIEKAKRQAARHRRKLNSHKHMRNTTNPVVAFFENWFKPRNETSAPEAQTKRNMKANRQATRHRRKLSSNKHMRNTTNPVVAFFENLFKPRNEASAHTRRHGVDTATNPVIRFFQRLLHRHAIVAPPSTRSSTIPYSTASDSNITMITPAVSWNSKDKDKVFDMPVGDRWAIASPNTNLTGKWKPIVSPQFKREYDEYLQSCGQSFAFRALCLQFVGTTREEITQDGNALTIRGRNPAGVWERTLISSGSDLMNAEFEPFNVTFLDPDKDAVNVEAWWKDEGTVHKSWLRNKPRVHGGEFESTRYMEEGGDSNVLVCESVFHPNGAKGLRPAAVKWRFEREE